jgi:hypothetical protein
MKALGSGQSRTNDAFGTERNLALARNLTQQKALTYSRELWGHAKNGSKPNKSKKPKKSKSRGSGDKNRSTMAPIASEEGAPLSQPSGKFMLAANTERTHKARSLMGVVLEESMIVGRWLLLTASTG